MLELPSGVVGGGDLGRFLGVVGGAILCGWFDDCGFMWDLNLCGGLWVDCASCVWLSAVWVIVLFW